MYYLTLIVVIVGFLLTGCEPAADPHAGHDGMDYGPVYSVENLSSGTGVAFSLSADGVAVAEYPVIHEKPMHLIVVRDDLTQFSHLHPELGADGVWRVPFVPAEGGTYWMYADFADKNGSPVVQRFTRKYDGDSPHGVKIDTAVSRQVDGMIVRFTPEFRGKEATLKFDVTRGGQPVELEPYLGANGHAVVLSADGQYLHAHAEAGEALTFTVTLPQADAFYRSFVQFQTGGKVHTVTFDVVQRPE